jgi:hypothetical protein
VLDRALDAQAGRLPENELERLEFELKLLENEFERLENVLEPFENG